MIWIVGMPSSRALSTQEVGEGRYRMRLGTVDLGESWSPEIPSNSLSRKHLETLGLSLRVSHHRLTDLLLGERLPLSFLEPLSGGSDTRYLLGIEIQSPGGGISLMEIVRSADTLLDIMRKAGRESHREEIDLYPILISGI